MTMAETIATVAISSLLVYLVGACWGGFTRGATLMTARAELVRESDLAIARMADDLRVAGAWDGEAGVCPWHGLPHNLRMVGVPQAGDGSLNNVCYYVESGQLMRRVDLPRDVETGESPPAEPVARFVEGLAASQVAPDPATEPGAPRALRDVVLHMKIPVLPGPSVREGNGAALERWRHLLVIGP
jgi:hypothetical protein